MDDKSRTRGKSTNLDSLSRTLFSVRLVNLDTYNAPPLHKDYGILHPIQETAKTTTNSALNSSVPTVTTTIHHPVIRVFGSTPAGQTCCVHFHGIFPYFYIHLEDTFTSSSINTNDRQRILSNPVGFCKALEQTLENELMVHTNNGSTKGYGTSMEGISTTIPNPTVSDPVSSSSSSLPASTASTPVIKKAIRSITLVKGIPYYGYHYSGPDADASISGMVRSTTPHSSSSMNPHHPPYSRILPHEQGHLFAKIILYSPSNVRRAVDILQSGRVFNTVYQPYEAHVPFLLQFLIDYNLCGMSLIHLNDVRFRLPLPLQFYRQQYIEKLVIHNPSRSPLPTVSQPSSATERHHASSTVALGYDTYDPNTKHNHHHNNHNEDAHIDDHPSSSVTIEDIYRIPFPQRVWIHRTTPSALCHPYPVTSLNPFTKHFLNDMVTDTPSDANDEDDVSEKNGKRTTLTSTSHLPFPNPSASFANPSSTTTTTSLSASGPLVTTPLPVPSWLQGDIYGIKRPQDIHGYAKNTTGMVSKETVCDIEVDAWVEDILNPLDRDTMRRNAALAADRAAVRRLQRKQRLQQADSKKEGEEKEEEEREEKNETVPFSSVFSLAYLWDEEKERRKALGLSQQSSPPPPLDTTLTTLSALTPGSINITTPDTQTSVTDTLPKLNESSVTNSTVNRMGTGTSTEGGGSGGGSGGSGGGGSGSGGGGYASREQWMNTKISTNKDSSSSSSVANSEPTNIIDIDFAMERQLQRIVQKDHQEEQKLRKDQWDNELPTKDGSSTVPSSSSSSSLPSSTAVWYSLPKADTLDYGKETIRLIPTVDRLMQIRHTIELSPNTAKDRPNEMVDTTSMNKEEQPMRLGTKTTEDQRSMVLSTPDEDQDKNIPLSYASGSELLEWLVNQPVIPTNTTRSSSLSSATQKSKSTTVGEPNDDATQPATPLPMHALTTPVKTDSGPSSSVTSTVSSRRSSVSNSSSSSSGVSSVDSTVEGTTPLRRNPLQNVSHEEGDNVFQRLTQRGRGNSVWARLSPRRSRSLTFSPEDRYRHSDNLPFSQTSFRPSQGKTTKKELVLPSPLSLVRLARLTEKLTEESTGKSTGKSMQTTIIKKRQPRTLELVPSYSSEKMVNEENVSSDNHVDRKSIRRARKEWDDIVLSQYDNHGEGRNEGKIQATEETIPVPSEFRTWLQVSQNNYDGNTNNNEYNERTDGKYSGSKNVPIENEVPSRMVQFAPDDLNEIVPYPFSDEDDDTERNAVTEREYEEDGQRGPIDIARNTIRLSGSGRRWIAYNQVEQMLRTNERTRSLQDIPERMLTEPVTPTVARLENFALESMGIHQSTPPPLISVSEESMMDTSVEAETKENENQVFDDRSVTPELDLSVVPNPEPMEVDATQPDPPKNGGTMIVDTDLNRPFTPPHFIVVPGKTEEKQTRKMIPEDDGMIEPPSRAALQRNYPTHIGMENTNRKEESEVPPNVVLDYDYLELTQAEHVPPISPVETTTETLRKDFWSTNLYRMNYVAPSAEHLLSTFHLYGLPEVVHNEPHYSNDKHVPDKPKIFAGMQFRIPGNSINYIPVFDTNTSILRYYQRQRAEEILNRQSYNDNISTGNSQRSSVSTSVSAYIAHRINDIHKRNNPVQGYEEPETFAITSTNGTNLPIQAPQNDYKDEEEEDEEDNNDEEDDYGSKTNLNNSIRPNITASSAAVQLNVYQQQSDLSMEDQQMLQHQLENISVPYVPFRSLEYYASSARRGEPTVSTDMNSLINIDNSSPILPRDSANIHAFIPETLPSNKVNNNSSTVSSFFFGSRADRTSTSLQLRRYILHQPQYNHLNRREIELCTHLNHVVLIPRSLSIVPSAQPRLKCVRIMVQWATPFPTYNQVKKWLKRYPIHIPETTTGSTDSTISVPKFDANTGSIIPEGQAIGCGNRGLLTTEGNEEHGELPYTPQPSTFPDHQPETPFSTSDAPNQAHDNLFVQGIGNENVSATLRNNNPLVGFKRKTVVPDPVIHNNDRASKSHRSSLPSVPPAPSHPHPSQPPSTPITVTSSQTISSTDVNQHLSVLSVEVHANSRGTLLPDPKLDSIQAIMYAIANDDIISIKRYQNMQENKDFEFPDALIVGCIMVDPLVSFHFKPSSVLEEDTGEQKLKSGLGISSRVRLITVPDEVTAIWTFVKLVRTWDIDILIGYEIQMASLGYMLDRARILRIPLGSVLSRTPYALPDRRLGTDDWGQLHDSGLWITGRIILNGWRLFRSEMKLNIYSFENVVWNTLRQRVPHFPPSILTTWWNGTSDVSANRTRNRVIDYFISRAALTLHLVDHIDLIGRSSEMARLFGIDFFSVLSRGSQYRVEAVMIRVSKPLGFLAPSASRVQVARQAAMECIPLIMEPQSRVYSSPVIVLDFQSLYPSIIIAYNMCYSTCIGRLASSADTVNPKLGFANYTPPPGIFARAYEGLGKATAVRKRVDQVVREFQHQLETGSSSSSSRPTAKRPHRPDSLFFSPNGTVFVPWTIRQGVLPRMLREILDTRVMVKNAMKGKEVKMDPVATRVMHARQFALKMIANVTYGYTAAGFSGRMPCAEIADAIVQTARSTLEGAIRIVESNDRWRARVVYGDTDSLFVSVPGRSVKEAFRIGEEIAETVTANNPRPITLKLEKVYHPCVLVAKKRYAGAMYESPTQETPTLDAKGLELVRRDQCGIVGTMMETSLRTLFATMNLSLLRDYTVQCWTAMFQGALSTADFIFAKEVRLGTYSARGPQPPAAVVASKAMLMDRRAEPRYGERVRYVVVLGAPEARLVDTVIPPLALLRNPGAYRLNVIYYITKAIIPSLDRILSLIGVDIKQWFTEMHRPTPRRIRVLPVLENTHDESSLSVPGGSSSSSSAKNRLFPNTFTLMTNATPSGDVIDLSSSPKDPDPPIIEPIDVVPSTTSVNEVPSEIHPATNEGSSSTSITTTTTTSSILTFGPPLPTLSSSVQGKPWWVKHDMRVHQNNLVQSTTTAFSTHNPPGRKLPYPTIHRPRTIDAYYAHSHCEVCGESTRSSLCENCTKNSQRSGYVLLQRRSQAEENQQRQMVTCMTCSRIADPSDTGAGACDSLDCPVLFDRFRFHDENVHLRSVLEEVGLLD